MIMLEAKARPGPADDPGARAIPAAVRAEPVDVKGDFDAIVRAMADVHHHRLAAHIGIGVLIAGETAGIGLAAPRDPKSVVFGKGVSVSVDIGWRRNIYKKKTQSTP